MPQSRQIPNINNALPYWISLILIPIIWFSAFRGGWWLVSIPVATWYLFTALDAVTGLNLKNANTDTDEADLFWHRLITLVWPPLQFITVFGLIWFVGATNHLSSFEKIVLFFGVGIMTGTIGINYSHELMHQKDKYERGLGDVMLAMVLYSHFRSEHLLVHHRYVGTPRDPVSARYNEGFHRFFIRVLVASARSSFQAEAAMLARKNLPWHDLSNPFFRYWALQGAMLILALILGGWGGFFLFVWQAYIAIWQLELVNYVEHYGLTRKHLGEGKYEHVMPHHSWNAAHMATNFLLINLQRHSDHHYKPDRRFPLLQTYDDSTAPQLPFGYPLMTMAAMVPPVWRRIMNPRVRKWRGMYYPEITDWGPYNRAENPMPR